MLTQREFAVKINALPKKWKAISKKIKWFGACVPRSYGRRNESQCKKCRLYKKNFIIYHKDQNNNNPQSLMTLCWECHNCTPTASILELYEEGLTSKCPGEDISFYAGSQPQPTGEGKGGNASSGSSKTVVKRGRPSGTTKEAKERRRLRHRGLKAIQDWHEWWWKNKHPLCKKCLDECKQSARVKIIVCPQFTSQWGRGATVEGK